jgi:hypothetical protein
VLRSSLSAVRLLLRSPRSSRPAPPEPALSEPALSEPALSEPALSEPALSEPALSEPALSDPALSEPALSDPALSDPALSDPAPSDPAPSGDPSAGRRHGRRAVRRSRTARLLVAGRITLTAATLAGIVTLVAATQGVLDAETRLPRTVAADQVRGLGTGVAGDVLADGRARQGSAVDVQQSADAVAAARQAAQERARAAALAERQRKAAAAAAARSAARAALSSAVSNPQAAARALLEARGWGGQYSCLNSLWQRESGWNYRAMNPSSGAYGIPQALPGSKMASAGADWRTNPLTQMRWGLDYIAGTYGTPCGAWAHSQATGWY